MPRRAQACQTAGAVSHQVATLIASTPASAAASVS